MEEPRAAYITKEYIDLMYWNFCMGLLQALSSIAGDPDSDQGAHSVAVAIDLLAEFQAIADGRAESMATRYAIRPSNRIVFLQDNGVFQVKTKPFTKPSAAC